MPELTPDELGALQDLVRDERSPFPLVECAACFTPITPAPLPDAPDRWIDVDGFTHCGPTDEPHAPQISCGACGGWHPPGENCDLDDIVDVINRDHWQDGWGIFECWGSNAGPWQIQKFDEPDGARAWETDADVWDWLYFRLIHGDQLAGRALVWVGNANPLERAAIIRNCITGPR